MKSLLLSVLLVGMLFTSCDNEDVVTKNDVTSKVVYQIELASPIDFNSKEFLDKDSVEVPITVTVVSKEGIQTKAVTEEVIPTNAVLTSRRGSVLAYFGPFWGNMLCDVKTLSVTVNYGYGQWVSGHKGPDTGLRPQGSVKSERVQLAVNNRIDDNSGSWTFSTAAYFPKSNYIGQVQVGCEEWYPFHFSKLKLYYTWIDGNN